MCHDKRGILKERLLKQDKTKGIDFRDVPRAGMTDFAHLNNYILLANPLWS